MQKCFKNELWQVAVSDVRVRSNFLNIFSKINGLFLHCIGIIYIAKNFAVESLFDSYSYFLLCCNDENWTEDDEREAEAVLDKDVMKLVLVGVSQHQVDVVVGEVDQDEAWQK